MNIHDLKEQYLLKKSYSTDDVNELLDFAKSSYIRQEIPTSIYRTLIGELEALGATNPESTNTHHDFVKSN